MTRYAAYMICTAPRSGSTLLCGLLAATGLAGRPESYFYGQTLGDWTADLGVSAGAAEGPALVRMLVAAAVVQGRGQTAIFGLRQQRPSFGFLCRMLDLGYPGRATDLARIEAAFGPTLFLHLTRQDKLGQAVSYLKAQQTGLWHVAPDGTEAERTAPHRAPSYDRAAIAAAMADLAGYDRGWTDWFAAEGIEAMPLRYDALARDPAGVLDLILDRLGLDRSAATDVRPAVRKMADATSRDWIARYRAEAGLS